MPKGLNLGELILKILKKNELSKKKISKELRKKLDRKISDKTINETLMKLLAEGKICLTGYDFDVYKGTRRIQSIRSDGLIFALIKTDPMEINILIKQLESDNPEEVKEALYRLKGIFRGKMEEVRDLNIQDVNALFNQIIFYINSQREDQKKS